MYVQFNPSHCALSRSALVKQALSQPTHISLFAYCYTLSSCCWSTRRRAFPIPSFQSQPYKNHRHMWTSHGMKILPCMPHLSSYSPNFFPPGAWFLALLCYHNIIFSNSPQNQKGQFELKHNNCGWVLAMAVWERRCRWTGLWWGTSYWKLFTQLVITRRGFVLTENSDREGLSLVSSQWCEPGLTTLSIRVVLSGSG